MASVGCAAEMKIEPFTAAHLAAVAALESVIFAGRDPWRQQAFERELESETSLWLLAFMDGELGGYAGGWVVGDEFHLLNLGVTPGLRRRGIGRGLLSEILARAAERGCTSALLDVRKSNLEARALYENAGFIERAIRPSYYSNGEDALLYSLVPIRAENKAS